MSRSGWLRIEVASADKYVTTLEVFVDDGDFRGKVRLACPPVDFDAVATAFDGFPKSAVDERAWEFPAIMGADGGRAAIRLNCSDSVGHAVCCVHLHEPPRSRQALPENEKPLRVVLAAFPIVASAVDNFVAELRGVKASAAARPGGSLPSR